MAHKPGDIESDRGWAAGGHSMAQARRLVRCFTDAERRPPETLEELVRWVSENPERIPFDEWGRVIPLYKADDQP